MPLLTFTTFADLLDSPGSDRTVEVGTGAGVVLLTVSSVTPAPDGHVGGSVLLTGSSLFPLGQDTFDVWVGGLEGPLLLVPLAEVDGIRTYEAVFA